MFPQLEAHQPEACRQELLTGPHLLLPPAKATLEVTAHAAGIQLGGHEGHPSLAES